MAFLSALVSAAAIKQPGAPWEKLILQVFDFVKNYGWRIIVFTLCLKLLLCPLDIYQRYKGRKNQKITEQLKPQMEKLARQYPDRQVLAQKQMELNKKAGYSYFSACLPALITIIVMFSLLGSLSKVSEYMNFKEYNEMYDVYVEARAEYEGFTDEEKAQLVTDGIVSDTRKEGDGTVMPAIKQYAQHEVSEYYHENKTSFLWIKNIWSPDVPWKKEVNSFSQFKKNIGKYATNPSKSGMSEQELSGRLNQYNNVMGLLLEEENNDANGYLILPILSILLSVGTQLLTMRMQKINGQVNEAMGGGSMKLMLFIMPIMIGIFSLSYTAAFTLYLIVSYAFGMVLNVTSNLIFWTIDKREAKKSANIIHKYGRPDPNDHN